jgi:formamidopyrimidine-DNA glycosylase
MPELPDVEIYRERLEARLVGHGFTAIRLGSPFVVRTYDPPLSAAVGPTIRAVRRLGKRLVFVFDDELFLVLHLMIAGRLRWRKAGAQHRGKDVLAVFDPTPPVEGCLVFTEASKKKRASLHVVRGEEALLDFDRGGIDVATAGVDAFAERLRAERHTLKRTLTDPRLFSGIGNAYSDEILFEAGMSPLRSSVALDDEEVQKLFDATIAVLDRYTARIREEVGEGFPDKVTAFRDDFAVHGRYKQACPVCNAPVQRIVRGDHETNYCANCQTDGRLLADRALSRLLKADWPRTLEELEERGAP